MANFILWTIYYVVECISGTIISCDYFSQHADYLS